MRFALTLCVALVACHGGDPAPVASEDGQVTPALDGGATAALPESACRACESYEPWEVQTRIDGYPLKELSGLAPSREHAGVFYAHNDSGDGARFFAFDAASTKRGEFVLEGAGALDWEDMGTGPCGGGDGAGSCVFVGDIGDNGLVRQPSAAAASYAIYVVREPALDPAGGKARLRATKVPFAYPDGPHNAETLLVDPKNGEVFVVTKSDGGREGIYRVPPPFDGTRRTLERAGELVVPPVGDLHLTAGSVHPCAPRVVLKTYGNFFEYRGAPGDSVAKILSTPVALTVAYAAEPQGEAVAYANNGLLWSSTEMPLGGAPPLQRATCSP